MSDNQFIDPTGKSALADYSAATNQYKLMKTTGSTVASVQVTKGAYTMGVLQNLPGSGEACNIAVGGVSFVRVNSTSSAAIAAGGLLTPATGGGGIASTAAGDFTFGRALEALAAATTGIIRASLTFEGSTA